MTDQYQDAIIIMLATIAIVSVMLLSLFWVKDESKQTAIMKSALIFCVVALCSIFLFGCSNIYPAQTQPRALGIGNMQPHCLFFCFQTNTQTDAESGATQTTANTSSQSATVSVDAQ